MKSEHCSLKIVELDFEIPAARTKGSLNTIEGFISNVIDDLSMLQEERRVEIKLKTFFVNIFAL